MISRRTLIQSIGMSSITPAVTGLAHLLSSPLICSNLSQIDSKRIIVLISAGIMSAILATYLSQLDPSLKIIMIEALNGFSTDRSIRSILYIPSYNQEIHS